MASTTAVAAEIGGRIEPRPTGRALGLAQFCPPQQRPALVGVLACGAILGAIFWSNIRYFVYVWSTDENYSHRFLVPLISMYFAREAAQWLR